MDKKPQQELHDAFTGELFQPLSRNHYEDNDGVPFAPPVDMPRPTIRQRVENLLNRGVNPLASYVGTEGIDMEVPEDGDSPLTPSEQNYLDVIASDLAEQAPLPDEGMPRPPQAAPLPEQPLASGAPPGPLQGQERASTPTAGISPTNTVPSR